MTDLSEIKACYLAQPMAHRLGYLALNLARLRSLARETADPMLVDSILLAASQSASASNSNHKSC